MEDKSTPDLLEKDEQLIPYDELVDTVNKFQDQLQSLDYRVTNKNFGSKLYQTKETINSKARFIAGADDDVAILDAQHPTFRFWVGTKDPLTAPFSVDKDGNVIATSISLTGYIAVDGALDDIGAGNITSTYLGTNSVTTGKIAANAVTATEIYVSTLSAISANIGTITAGTITGITITGGTIQTSSSGLRTVLDAADDKIKFMSGTTVYGSIFPYVYAGGSGVGFETTTADAFLYLQEGTTNSVSIGVTGGGIFITTTSISMSEDVEFNNNNLLTCGNIEASDTSSDIGEATTPFDHLYIRDIYMDAQTANPSVDGQMRYYDSGAEGLRMQFGGSDFQFDASGV